VVIEALCALQKIKVRAPLPRISHTVAFRYVLPYVTTSPKVPAVINRAHSSISAAHAHLVGGILDARAQTRLLRPNTGCCVPLY
jgi:hypothetical protein